MVIPFQLLIYAFEIFSSLNTYTCLDLGIHLHFPLPSKAECPVSGRDSTIHPLT